MAQVHRPALPRFINAAYYPANWLADGQLNGRLNYACINVVFVAFASLKPDGTVFLEHPVSGLDLDPERNHTVSSFVELRDQNRHLRLVLSIGGSDGSSNFAAVAADEAKRRRFACSAEDLVYRCAFEGIDVDWEHPADRQQGHNFILLLDEIRRRLPRGEYILTAALPAARWALRHVNLGLAGHILDYLNLMAYDFVGPWSTRAGHHAQLYSGYPGSAEEPCGAVAVSYSIQCGFPAQRLLLGIPAYGYFFRQMTLGGYASPSQTRTYEYRDLLALSSRTTHHMNKVAVSMSDEHGGFITYDAPWSVRLKAEYCKTNGLGGLFYWHALGDVPSGWLSLIEAGHRELNWRVVPIGAPQPSTNGYMNGVNGNH
ncbi:MAG: hypothetical protein M1818_003853 [Claussenomyces sp. TS43310]|nr:MAG: hypothetical protein M1818_003853 [Claussenomyces sp. TS43310]